MTTATETSSFPSVAWFERLAEVMRDQRQRHIKAGEIDCIAQFTVIDPDGEGRDRHFQVEFEEFDAITVREVGYDDSNDADFVMETDALVWQEMIEVIVAGGGDAGLEHSLNRLSLPGVPMRVWSEDPLRRDMFFRYNSNLQLFVNGCSEFATHFEYAGV